MNRSAIVWSALAIASSAPIAMAQTPGPNTISLEYIAPTTCPDEISLRAGVIARLGRDPFHGDAPRKAFIDVEPTAAGFVAAIELREQGRPPSRRAVGPTAKCEDAVAALELALAVIIDPAYATPPQPPAPQPRPAQTGPMIYEPPGWRGLPPPNQPVGPPKHELAFALGGVAGSVPEVAFAINLRAAYLLPKYRIGIVGRLSSSGGPLDTSHEFEYRVNQSEVLAELCLRQWKFVNLCGGAGFGVKGVTITDWSLMNRDAEYSDPFFEVAASASVDVPLGRAFFRPTVEFAVPFPTIKIESRGVERWRVGLGQLAFDLALGYRW